MLKDVIRITIVRVELNSISYETSDVVAYKANDTFSIYMSGPQYMIDVSLIYKTSFEKSRYNWSKSS